MRLSPLELTVLGVIAGFTIFLGLPIGRVTKRSAGLVSILNALTVGILVFLLWDVLTHAIEPVESALGDAISGTRGWYPFAGLAVAFSFAIALGLLGLVVYDKSIERAAMRRLGTNTAHSHSVLHLDEPQSRLAFLIAVGIGLHNFSEGLAIGQSAAGGRLNVAVVLVVGFALHNATEGFGITAPLAGGARRPGWLQLGLLGLIGGVPTLAGTLLGGVFVSDLVSTIFLALAAGSIFYVIVQLVVVSVKLGRGMGFYVGALAGILAGFATDFVVTAAGV
ncbi:MAG: putative metal cation transporter [Glaciihabitans sp.]|nr:putative metal cation transporter [Glaciihabitans sp.]MDQ1569856.1 zinc transporter, family [Actinomycetota bacterium]